MLVNNFNLPPCCTVGDVSGKEVFCDNCGRETDGYKLCLVCQQVKDFFCRKEPISLPKIEPITTVLEAAPVQPSDARDHMQVRLVRIHATFGAIRERALQINDLTILRCCNDVIDDAYFLMQEFKKTKT